MSELVSRLKKLESWNPQAKRVEWRAYLAPFFAGSEYDGHREAIVEALCSDTPRYDFERPGVDDWGQQTVLHYLVDWSHRDQADMYGTRKPMILAVPADIWDALT